MSTQHLNKSYNKKLCKFKNGLFRWSLGALHGNLAGNKPCLDLELLKRITFMVILSQIRLCLGCLCPRGKNTPTLFSLILDPNNVRYQQQQEHLIQLALQSCAVFALNGPVKWFIWSYMFNLSKWFVNTDSAASNFALSRW